MGSPAAADWRLLVSSNQVKNCGQSEIRLERCRRDSNGKEHCGWQDYLNPPMIILGAVMRKLVHVAFGILENLSIPHFISLDTDNSINAGFRESVQAPRG
ncbi:MAG: hypothetical protein ACREXS_19445 [Gammaproteobacteria bacterium]